MSINSGKSLSFLEEALKLAKLGFRILPLRPTKKIPRLTHWPDLATTDPTTIMVWWSDSPTSNIGIATGKLSGIIVIDVDTKDGKDGTFNLATLELKWGVLPPTMEVSTGSGGRHLYFAYPDKFPIPSWKPFPDVEIKSDGSQVVAPPSSCIGGEKGHMQPYRFLSSGIVELPTEWAYRLSLGHIEKVRNPKKSTPHIPEGSSDEEVRSALFAISPDAGYEEWIKAGMALFSISPSHENLWHEWSGGSPQYSRRESDEKWKSFSQNRSITGASLFYLAGQYGWKPQRRREIAKVREDKRNIPAIKVSERDEHGCFTGRSIDSPGDAWKHLLHLTEKMTPKVNTYNLLLVLQNDPLYRGNICYNEFSLEAVFKKESGVLEPFTDARIVLLAGDLENRYRFGGAINPKMLNGIIEAAACHFPIHPIRDWLSSLKWDGTERLEHLFPFYYYSKDTPYTQAVGRNFLIGGVARIFRPGCKLDTLIVLEGIQGLMKSTSLKILFGEEYTSEIGEAPGSKDFHQVLRGKWCLEFADLDTFKKTDNDRLKSQLSTQNDNYRASYGMRNSDHPRQSIFAGTTNDDKYSRDGTGSRRLWPILCRKIDLSALKKDRTQLWAEAVFKFKNGATWHEVPAQAAKDEQEQRRLIHPWEDLIRTWLDGPFSVGAITTPRIFDEVLKKDPEMRTRRDEMDISEALRALGYAHDKKTNFRPRQFVLIDEETASL